MMLDICLSQGWRGTFFLLPGRLEKLGSNSLMMEGGRGIAFSSLLLLSLIHWKN